ncbi:DMT family transporter [Zobellella maritima]|uniref:DMT family transporter n=1 Tax=Zobellella maritima TaxID=2059725 RepID=UPI000E2FF7E6|nr:DMT family transporter [Zobellella maritima]
MLWIPFTLMAAFMQAWRNAFQKQLSKEVKSAGVTLARFIWAGPLAGAYLWGLYQWQPGELPRFTPLFFGYILAASVAQILATNLMVKLFQLKNFAIGVGLAKSEAILAAALGVVFFSAPLTALGWLGVLLGAVAVFLLSGVKKLRGLSWRTLALGLGSGLAFALTSLWVREASLELGLPFPYGAAWVLLLVISLQTLLLTGWLWLKDRATLRALLARPRLTLLISGCSCLGSIGWFTAMSLETVAMVKTLGQVEVLFTLLISAFFFKEVLARNDQLGLALIVTAALCVMWS